MNRIEHATIDGRNGKAEMLAQVEQEMIAARARLATVEELLGSTRCADVLVGLRDECAALRERLAREEPIVRRMRRDWIGRGG